MPPSCSRGARWLICSWRGKNCCSWHRLSPGAKVADHGRAAQAGGRPEKPNSSACTGLAEHLLPRRHGLIQSFPSSSNGLLVHTHASSSDGLLVHTHERNRSPGVKVEGLGLLVSRDRTAATPARAISPQTFSLLGRAGTTRLCNATC